MQGKPTSKATHQVVHKNSEFMDYSPCIGPGLWAFLQNILEPIDPIPGPCPCPGAYSVPVHCERTIRAAASLVNISQTILIMFTILLDQS